MAFAHCISPLSLDEIRDMQDDMTASNRRRTPSGRFEAVENTSTSSGLILESQNLLDEGVMKVISDASKFHRAAASPVLNLSRLPGSVLRIVKHPDSLDSGCVSR